MRNQKKTDDSKNVHRKSPEREDVENRHERNSQSAKSSSMNISDELINNIQNEFPDINISRNKPIYNGIKTQVATELSSGWTLAVGEKKTFYFCGIYKEERTDNPYPEVFDIKVKNGYYKRFKTDREALNQFEDILQRKTKNK